MSRARWLGSALALCLSVGACHPEREDSLRKLASPSPIERAQAVQVLGHLGDPDDLGALVGEVGDPDPFVRAAVAEALGHVEDRRSADALAELLGDASEPVALQAVAALGRLRGPRAHAYLVLAYQRGGVAIRVKVAELLQDSDGGSAAEAVQAEATALYAEYSKDLSGSGYARLTAAEQLGHSGRPEAVERLSSYLGAESHALAAAAARGLGASQAPEARPPLEALLSEEDPDLQRAGAQALGDLGLPEAGPALLRTVLRGGTVASVALASLLKVSGEPEAPQRPSLLCGAALAPDPELAAEAGRQVRQRGIECAADPFLAKLRRGDADAAGALAGLAELWRRDPAPESSPAADAGLSVAPPGLSREAIVQEKFLRPVGALIRDGPPEVRPLAAHAATSLGLQALLPELTAARKEAEAVLSRARERWVQEPLPQQFSAGFGDAPGAPEGPSHTKVQALLGKLGALGFETVADDPTREPSLFSSPPPAAVALWAEASLGEIRFQAPEAQARLVALRGDPSPRARRVAVEAVRYLPEAAQWAALTPLLEDVNPTVREAAADAAGQTATSVTAASQWLLDQVKSAGGGPDLPLVALITALGRRPVLPGVVSALAAQLDRPDAAAAAVGALRALGTPESRAALLEALKAARGVGLPDLLEAIGGSPREPSALAYCKPLLFHPAPEVRAAAVRAVRAQGGTAAQVQSLSVDYDVRVRMAVAGH